MSPKSAVIIGATGLVGAEIVRQLLTDSRISSVLAFVRRSTGLSHFKFQEKIVDFKKMAEWKNQVKGELAFSALGTTRAQAGSLEAQYEIDYTYQAEFARACAQNGVQSFVLISAMNASPSSLVPYSKMKGKLEDFVKRLGFDSLHILRPGMLEGQRQNPRKGEELAVPLIRVLSKIPGLKSLAPVKGSKVAAVAIEAAFAAPETRTLMAAEILR
jgi:uncharacterized protein YbjT (DUF2867 family)